MAANEGPLLETRQCLKARRILAINVVAEFFGMPDRARSLREENTAAVSETLPKRC